MELVSTRVTRKQTHRCVMISFVRCACLSLALAVSPIALAGEVADLVTFMPGTPARASEVNGNFAALSTAVNDNHARLTATETSQSDLDASLQALQSVTASYEARISSLQSELAALRAQLRAPGVISLPVEAFSNHVDMPCTYKPESTSGYFDGPAGSGCSAAAPVHLPHGVQVTAVRCTYYDGSDGKIRSFSFGVQNLELGGGGYAWWSYSTHGTSDSDTPYNLVVPLTSESGSRLIDNSTSAYYLSVGATASSDRYQLQFSGCRIHYEYPE
jgi:hypothetical protein